MPLSVSSWQSSVSHSLTSALAAPVRVYWRWRQGGRECGSGDGEEGGYVVVQVEGGVW